MKKLICQESKCLFDDYEPVTLYESQNYPTEYIGNESVVLQPSAEFLGCKYIDIEYEVGHLANSSYCKRIPVSDMKIAGEVYGVTRDFKLSGEESNADFFLGEGEEADTYYVKQYVKTYHVDSSGMITTKFGDKPKEFVRTTLENGVAPVVEHFLIPEEASMSEDPIRIYKIIGWK